nr:histidine kinase [uncultured Blautia sp.]
MKKIREKLDVYLNNLKIKRKIFLLYFYCVVLPLVLTDTVICGMFVHDEKEAREARLKNMVKSVEYMLNSAAEEAAALSENIYFNKYINEFLNEEFSSGLDYYNQYQELLKDSLFDSSLGTSNAIITMYTDNPTVVNGGKFWKMDRIKGKAWYEKFLASGQEMQMYFYFEASGTTNLKLPRKASFVRKLDRYKRDPYQKLLKIDLDYAGINQNLIMSNYEDEVYVCQGEKIIFSNSRKLNLQQDFEKITEVRRKKGEYVESFHLFGQDLDVYAIPQQGNFLQGILQHWPSIVLLILFNVLIPCVFMQALRRTFTERLEILNRTINYRDKGKLGEIQGIQGTDEIAVLMRNYNNMVEENNHLIETVYKSRLKQQEINIARQKAELLALHGQINPHFLFNVLENIRMRSVLKQEYETAEMIEQLSIMERQYVEWGTDLLPISEEQKFVEAYLKLQKYRFGNRLSYTIEIEEGCEAYKIPKLSLVTFVENACVHGIEDKATQCWIFVRVYQKQEELYMEIEDTGSGMPEAYLSILREKMEHASIEMLKQKGSVGMVNACLRLKMYTEERVKILLESEECVGTMVTISIPVHALK